MAASEAEPELEPPCEARPPLGRPLLGWAALPGWRGELVLGAFFLLAALVLTWPVAITLDQATGVRGDYFNNVWNVWWVKHAITEGHSPWFTDYLYYPDGLSLQRHTLSPINALAGVLVSTFLGPHEAFNVLMIGTFAASAWALSLLARYVTGSVAGSVLAGLVYSFNPFHYYYVCQVNVSTLQFLPLALLFFVKVFREGGWRNAVLAALCTGAIAASIEYYVIYTAFAVALLLLFGKLLDRGVPWRTGALRLTGAGALCALSVGLAALPLILGSFGADAEASGTGEFTLQKRRANDLIGYLWVGGPEWATVSWPTMLGYSTLLLLAVTARRWLRRHAFWVLLGLAFWVLSLGRELYVDREPTGILLPYAWLSLVPGLDMLRKPDRCFVFVQFAVALLCAGAWTAVADRLARPAQRRAAWCLVTALVMVELTGVPFRRFDYELPAYTAVLARDEDVETVLDLPPMNIDVMNARYSFFQTGHEKKQPLGYCTALALNRAHSQQMQVVVNTFLYWLGGEKAFPSWIRQRGIDRVVLHKTIPTDRPPDPTIHERVFWEPFFLVRAKLFGIRQTGQYLDVPFEPGPLFELQLLATEEFGPHLYEDDDVFIYDARGTGGPGRRSFSSPEARSPEARSKDG